MTIAVILAAGKGERLGEIARTTPKPMLPVLGKPILEHTIELCKAHGITDLLINLHHQPDIIQNHFGDGSKWGVRIRYRYEPDILGTSGAIRNFREEIGHEPFFVLYGDNGFDYDLTDMKRQHDKSTAAMTIAVFHLDDARQSGLVTISDDNRVLAFQEKPQGDRPIPGWVNAGLYLMKPSLVEDIPHGSSDFGKDVIPDLLRKGTRIQAMRMDHPVKAIDTPELYKQWT